MSVVAALTEMFACAELTHPVTLGAASARGIYDETGEMVPLAGLEMQVIGPMLYVRKGALAALEQGVDVTLGEIGAASASGGRTLRAHRVMPVHDGQILALQLGGGR